jgi:hypothetical protein
MWSRIAAAVMLGLALDARSASSQAARTNFAGRWVLDIARSEHGLVTPSAMQLTIEQSGDTIRAATHSISATGESKTVSVYDLSGRPTRNTVNQGGGEVVLTTTTAWNGSALVVKTAGESQGQNLTQNTVRTLADDGKMLESAITIDVAGRHVVTHLVLAKSARGT